MPRASTVSNGMQAVHFNLVGQRLGRKGRDTRERILSATERLLADPDATISLSAVAREASLAMTTLYLYFGDLVELLLALLEPVMESAEASHVAHMRGFWDDAELNAHCYRFVRSYYAYWKRNARLLHLRNSLADGGDERMRKHRILAAQPLIEMVMHQMGCESAEPSSLPRGMAAVLVTGVERVVTVSTNQSYSPGPLSKEYIRNCLASQARLLELGIREFRGTGLQKNWIAHIGDGVLDEEGWSDPGRTCI